LVQPAPAISLFGESKSMSTLEQIEAAILTLLSRSAPAIPNLKFSEVETLDFPLKPSSVKET
jgi:hypothetical protein